MCIRDSRNIDQVLTFVVTQATTGVTRADLILSIPGAVTCLKRMGGAVPKGRVPKPSQTWNTGKNADRLAKNMGITRGSGWHAHHIVPSTHRRAWEARSILQKFGIDINAAVNGAKLSHAQHKGVHSFKYIDWVTNELKGAKTKQQAQNILKKIEKILQKPASQRPF